MIPRFLRPLLARAEAWARPGGAPRRLLGVELTVGSVLELLARLGYGARGFVYISIGAIALLAAADWLPRPRSAAEAVAPILRLPFGSVWAAGIAFGLGGFALWRAAQVLLDADRQGRSPKAIASRIGQAISGVVYGALALSVLEFLDEVEDHLEGDAEARRQAAEVLSWPGGQWLLMGVGLFVLGCGIGNMVQGLLTDFGKRLGCGPGTRQWAGWVGKIGYAARGVAFLPLGAYFLQAARSMKSGQARDLGGALQALEAQPYGSLLLGLISAGLVAFGIFALVEGRFRRIDVPEPDEVMAEAAGGRERAA